MRIGEISKLTGVNIPTIRYYISIGLIVPEQSGSQFFFNEDDVASLNTITKFKNWGFKLNDIHRILTLKRISTGVESEEYGDYISLLFDHKKELLDERSRIQQSIDEIEEEISSRGETAFSEKCSGLPLRMLDLTACPICGETLGIKDADMNIRYIYSGTLHCQCGFHAEIRNGIIYMPENESKEHDKPDINRDVYRSCPNELMSLIQRSYNWMSTEIHLLPAVRNRVVMETHLNSFFYLYKNFKYLNPDDIFIIQDKFPEVVELYKKYIDRIQGGLDIMYIASDSLHLPLKSGCVDLLIDYNSTNEHAIFSDTFYPSRMRPFLKKDAYLVGTYFYFQPMSKSLKQLRESYPRNQAANYTHDYFFNNISNDYKLIKQKPLGYSTDSGEGLTFSFHKTDDKLFMNCYAAKAK
ncbi:MAG: MerR family transcriptional regulator [Lachnospiraceae bacterium]|nr:MerR family transcriptional regulator [Lachnospiraceae bacterium]